MPYMLTWRREVTLVSFPPQKFVRPLWCFILILESQWISRSIELQSHISVPNFAVTCWCVRKFNPLNAELTLNLLTWRIWWAPNNASSWQMGFNSAFKVLNPICHLLALSVAHHIFHVNGFRVKWHTHTETRVTWPIHKLALLIQEGRID